MPDASPVAIPAATLIVLRDRPSDVPEILMVRRSRQMAFAPGALVFPGGRVDPGDHALAGEGDDEAAARIAAIRETAEEAGILAGVDVRGSDQGPLRAMIAAGMPFAGALAAMGGVLRPETLVPFARWRPGEPVSRRFDARFYLARAPAGLPPPIADGAENDRAFWTSAAEALAEVGAGRATMIFPTRRTTERLALFGDVDAAFADARAHPVRTITPWIEPRGGVPHLCIPDDLGFPVTAEPLADTVRG